MMQYKMERASLTTGLVLLAATPVLAQTPPDAGQILQQSQETQITPLAPSVELELDGEPLTEGEPGGAEVTLQEIRFSGNTLFDAERLRAVLGEAVEQPQDMAGLQQLANRISQFYRDNGYPFARALLPAQDLGSGALIIEVVEGNYGRVHASGPEPLASDLQPWLAPLEPGTPIASAPLERRLLLLGDLPGVAATPVMRPGQRTGTGELEVQVRPAQRVTGLVGADNHGSRYSGEYRGRTSLNVNRLARVGDELSLTALYTSESTWLGNLRYESPIGVSGLRGALGYAHTNYTLDQGFEGYTGTADVYSAELRYPLLRRQQSNVSVSARYQYKELDDEVEFADYLRATESHGLPLSLEFDTRDALGRGGITFGTLTLTPGKLERSDPVLGDKDYGFTKVNLDVARLQALGAGLELYGRINAQWSDRDELDSSESFNLGGPNGVRAYPVGEGSGSRGWLTQFELRYSAGKGFAPYAFYDAGRTSDGGMNVGEAREVAGAGVGLRYRAGDFKLNVASAWKTQGGDAQSEGRQRDPRVWASLGYQF
ncbi:ShlB/FhaC/HecB family hemolysin secretion/activation protein [Chromohalobacter nigrandesensis]|uniref:ShlB/FhaC/HecB family hemolysin secretion/activation protein n=1 Tax=Chromohalobacter nigrandesensis TaxID=119863 RepID=UPI001FF5D6AB|nr:ShlB/FhaC/HecB family hemolysin secretion/activation protein [Chromohalobacter nigrandesensis]MCK0745100.1 ShlB/FhaC/HecB family hemolysin secretion/activation protein [Chromohalobacter nigrandesensis]